MPARPLRKKTAHETHEGHKECPQAALKIAYEKRGKYEKIQACPARPPLKKLLTKHTKYPATLPKKLPAKNTENTENVQGNRGYHLG